MSQKTNTIFSMFFLYTTPIVGSEASRLCSLFATDIYIEINQSNTKTKNKPEICAASC